MDDKNRLWIPLILCNLVVVFYQVFFNSGDAFTWGKFFLAIGMGLVVGAVAFGAMTAIKR